MNEKKEAEQFLQDVDDILRQVSPGENSQWPEAHHREMQIVQALASADFSADSRVRQTLKQKLRQAPHGQKEFLMNTRLFQRSVGRIAVAAVVVVFLILALSPLGASLAQSLVQIVQDWQVGENTTAVSVDGDFEAVPDEDGEIVILPAPESAPDLEEMPEIAGEGEDIQEEEIQEERQITLDPTISFDEAQTEVSFALRQPGFVPEGYEFQGVVLIHPGQVSLDYMNLADVRLMGLLQTAVGGSNGKVQVTFSSDTEVVETTVNGQEALWALDGDEGLLVWEADGINYQLMGLSDLELALQVAESLE